MDEVLILGAGGHGREIAQIILDINNVRESFVIKGFIDDNRALIGKKVMGIPVTGDLKGALERRNGALSLVMGISDPWTKRRIFEDLSGMDIHWPNIVHPSARVVDNALLGKGIAIFPNCVISTNAEIGDLTCLNTSVSVSHDARIGRFCNINPGCFINGEVRIGDCVYLGSAAVIIHQRMVGESAIIGAGSVVIREVPPNTTSVGNPSRVIKVRSPGGER